MITTTTNTSDARQEYTLDTELENAMQALLRSFSEVEVEEEPITVEVKPIAVTSVPQTESAGMKKCSRCARLGRTEFHPVERFSILKNGKLHSQCKACRVEQTVTWDKSQGERRKQYQKEYQKRRKPAVRRKKQSNGAVCTETGSSALTALSAMFE